MGAGRRRIAGVSQVATVLALILVSFSAAILVWGPLRGYVSRIVSRQALVADAELEIVSVNTGGGVIAGVRLRNLGPGTISYDDVGDWQVVVDGMLRRVWQVSPGPPAQIRPGETITVGLTRATAPSSSEPHSITVYGPGGVKAQASYQPPGG